MPSVTGRIAMVKQPRGGYLNIKQFETFSIDDGMILHDEENIHASLVGLAVDYLTRFLMGTPASEAFYISVLGAESLDFSNAVKRLLSRDMQRKPKSIEKEKVQKLLSTIKGTDDNSIISACKVAGYDVCFRVGSIAYKPIEEINPDQKTIDNIRIMLNRCLLFLEQIWTNN